MSNIDNQLTSGIGKKSNVPAILIWGAPGIGKTAILKGVAEDFRNDPDYDYNLHV
jgi:replication-associated recombination protein RarA